MRSRTFPLREATFTVFGVTELLVLLALVVLFAAGCLALARLRQLLANLDRLADQFEGNKPSYDQLVDSLAGRMRAVEVASGNTEQTGRSLSRQLTELNRLLVDQAVILVEVRAGMNKAQDVRPDGQPAAGPSQDGQDG